MWSRRNLFFGWLLYNSLIANLGEFSSVVIFLYFIKNLYGGVKYKYMYLAGKVYEREECKW